MISPNNKEIQQYFWDSYELCIKWNSETLLFIQLLFSQLLHSHHFSLGLQHEILLGFKCTGLHVVDNMLVLAICKPCQGKMGIQDYVPFLLQAFQQCDCLRWTQMSSCRYFTIYSMACDTAMHDNLLSQLLYFYQQHMSSIFLFNLKMHIFGI